MSTAPYLQRRQRLMAQLGSGIVILPTARHAVRNADTHYPYRPDSSFYYLTGFDEPEAVLVLDATAGKSVLFCRDKDIEREIWNGYRFGPEGAKETFGFDEAYSISEFDERLPDLLLGCLGSGRQVNLAGLRGSPMVINFWAQWCGPCRAEAPSLAQFAQRAHGKVAVLGVDYSDPDPSLALAFAQQSGWTYPHVTDPLRQTAGPIRFTGIPVTIFVDAQGRIVYRTVGAVASVDQLVEATHTYLGVDL